MYLKVQTVADVDRYMDQLRASARRAQKWLAAQSGDPLDLLRCMKFDAVGFHPVADRPLNFIEQVNQTWTFAVASKKLKLTDAKEMFQQMRDHAYSTMLYVPEPPV
jgi:hypothetical protein